MNIDELTLGQIKEIQALAFNSAPAGQKASQLIGKKVIIRTYSAGVHYGELIEKEGAEVILKDARRLWYWKTTNKGISLSEVANSGVSKDSKVCDAVPLIWLTAIEIIPCSKDAIKNIEGQDVYKA